KPRIEAAFQRTLGLDEQSAVKLQGIYIRAELEASCDGPHFRGIPAVQPLSRLAERGAAQSLARTEGGEGKQQDTRKNKQLHKDKTNNLPRLLVLSEIASFFAFRAGPGSEKRAQSGHPGDRLDPAV